MRARDCRWGEQAERPQERALGEGEKTRDAEEGERREDARARSGPPSCPCRLLERRRWYSTANLLVALNQHVKAAPARAACSLFPRRAAPPLHLAAPSQRLPTPARPSFASGLSHAVAVPMLHALVLEPCAGSGRCRPRRARLQLRAAQGRLRPTL